MKMSPAKVQFLLHYYCIPGDHEKADSTTYWIEIGDEFVAAGLLTRVEGDAQKYRANPEALSAYVEALLAVPLPKQKWIVE